MSRRSQVIREQNSLRDTPVVPLFANKQSPPQPQKVNVGLGQLWELLMAQGVARRYTIGTSDAPVKVVRLTAICGDLILPLDFTPGEVRALAEQLCGAADLIDPPADDAEESVMASAEGEDLLAEFIARADKSSGGELTVPDAKCPRCDASLVGHQLSKPTGEWLPDKYYCYPCMSVVDLSGDPGSMLIGEPDRGTSWLPGAVERQSTSDVA
jgi:hypothetical protein